MMNTVLEIENRRIPPSGSQEGSSLLFVILTITLLSVLATVSMNLTSTSSIQEITYNKRDRAQFLAEAGYNYFESRLAELQSLNTNRADILTDLSGTYAVDQWGSFTLTVTDPNGSGDFDVEILATVAGTTQTEAYFAMNIHPNSPPFRREEFIREGFEEDPDTNQWVWDENFVEIQSYFSTNGSHVYYARLDSVPIQTATYADGTQEQYTGFEFCLDKNEELTSAWSENGNLLSYDLQIKLGAGFRLEFMAWGLSFRHHPYSVNFQNYYPSYGLSFMKYYDGSVSSNFQDFEDGIPEGIKPPGMGSVVSSWTANNSYCGWYYVNHRWQYICSEGIPDHPYYSSERVMVVLWRRTINEANDPPYDYQWLAYKELYRNGSYRDSALYPQWTSDTQSVTDNTTLMARVIERNESGNYNSRHNEITVFYADPSITRAPNRTLNTNSSDISWWKNDGYTPSRDYQGRRNYYLPSWSYIERGMDNKFASWPTIYSDEWAEEDDYFTLIEGPGAEVVTPIPMEWDAINPAGSIVAVNDPHRGTVFIDTTFLTPSGGSFNGANPEDRYEICLHGFAEPHLPTTDVSEANQSLAFDDFAADLLYFVPDFTEND